MAQLAPITRHVSQWLSAAILVLGVGAAADAPSREEGFRAWIRASDDRVVSWGGRLDSGRSGETVAFAARTCPDRDGVAEVWVERVDGRRYRFEEADWHVCMGHDEAEWSPQTPGEVVISERLAGYAFGTVTLGFVSDQPVIVARGFHYGRLGIDKISREDLVRCVGRIEGKDCSESEDESECVSLDADLVVPECPRPYDLVVNRPGDAKPAITESELSSGRTDARFTMQVELSADGHAVLVATVPTMDARPSPDAPLEAIRRSDHFLLWYGSEQFAVVIDSTGAISVRPFQPPPRSPPPPPPRVSLADGRLRIRLPHPMPASAREAVGVALAFSDGDGKEQKGLVATSPLRKGVPVGRVYDPRWRWPEMPGLREEGIAPGSPAAGRQ